MNYLPKVSIIVPVWVNNEDGYLMTVRCLASMLTTDYTNLEIIVVDDCSPYEVLSKLKEHFDDTIIQFYQTPENGGSTVAVNHGIQYATGSLIQYQNNDTEFPHPEWLHEQVRLLQEPRVGVVGSLLRYPNGTIQHAGACWRKEGDHSIDHIGQHQEEIKYLEDVPFVTGCGMTVRRDILEQNGGGFTVFEGYGWDDIDIQVKAKDWGWKVKVAPKSQFTHFGSFTYKQRPELASRVNYLKNKFLFDDVEIKLEETIGYFKEHYYLD